MCSPTVLTATPHETFDALMAAINAKKINKKAGGAVKSTASDSLPRMVYNEEAKMHAPKAYMSTVLQRLNEFRCPSCGRVFPASDNIRVIKRHLTEAHSRDVCDVCLTGRKIFRSELKVYTPEELDEHNDKGDDDTGRCGHPECNMCRKRFFDNDVLASHQTDDHHVCFVCENLGAPEPAFFSNTTDLHDHFRRAHFLCKTCKKLRVINVFGTSEDLAEHNSRRHSRGGSTSGGGVRYR